MPKRTLQRAYALWKGEERYRVLFESIDEGFCVVEVLFDATGAAHDYRYLETNPAFEKLTGLRNAAGKRMRDLEPRHEAHWYEIYGSVAQTGHPQRFVSQARYLRNRWFDLYAFRVGRPEERKVAVLFTDVSERKCAEDKLRQSEERFRAFIDASSEIVYRMSGDWRELLALGDRDFSGDEQRPQATWLIDKYIHPDDRAHVMAAVEEAIRAKSVLQVEHRVQRDDGTQGWTLTRAVPLLADDGSIKEWFGTASDITARKEAEEKVRAVDRAKDEFLAVLGHELRNPLAAMGTAFEVLETARSHPERIDTIAPMLRRQFAQLKRLVDDLLDISRVARGQADLQRAPLDLRIVVEAAVEQCTPLIREREHELVLDLAASPVPIRGDLLRLTQVVGNLLTNAAKYDAARGTITVSCGMEGREGVVRVRDTGFGIPPHRLASLFVMFNRVPEHRTLGGGGLGVGLALARQLVEMHDGSIEAMSAGLGHGSEFIVRLPLEASAQERAPAPAAGDESHAGRAPRRVLVVDDNVDAADSLRMVLHLWGHDTRAVYDGTAALDTLQSFDAEVVLLDIGMPHMDGLEVARRIRAMPREHSPRLIALTGWGQVEDKQRTRDAGFDEHLTKPVDALALAKLIEEGSAARRHEGGTPPVSHRS